MSTETVSIDKTVENLLDLLNEQATVLMETNENFAELLNEAAGYLREVGERNAWCGGLVHVADRIYKALRDAGHD